jgi:hypothetical protein
MHEVAHGLQMRQSNCFATFHYLHEGRLLIMDEREASPLRTTSRSPRFFWLCSQCAQTLAVTYDAQDGMRLIAVQPTR